MNEKQEEPPDGQEIIEALEDFADSADRGTVETDFTFTERLTIRLNQSQIKKLNQIAASLRQTHRGLVKSRTDVISHLISAWRPE